MICFSGTLLFEPGGLFVEIGACEFVVEMQGYVWHLLECIQKAFIERCSVHSLNALLRLISIFHTLVGGDGPFRLHHRLEILHIIPQFSVVHVSCGRALVWSLPTHLQEAPRIGIASWS